MTLKASTGLRNQLLDSNCLRNILDFGFIKIYSGPVPATADDALTGTTLLTTLTVSSGSDGLRMDTNASNGILSKAPAEVWSGVNVAGGVASFYRHVAPGDTGVLSTTEARIQGQIAMGGSDMNMTAGTTLPAGATQTQDFYTLNLPTL